MTDRHVAYTVVLEREVREDDAQRIIEAIGMVKGVREVVPVVADPGTYFAVASVRWEILGELQEVVRRW